MVSSIIETLSGRGLIQDSSDESVINSLAAGDAFYIGFDPTAPSLQIGNLVPLIVSTHLAQAGLTPIILFGGATGAIGDPSGKSEERKLLSREVLDANIVNQQQKAVEIMGRMDVTPTFVNNLDWTRDVSILDFLRDVGKHFTVNYMLAKEVVKARLGGDGISYTEFSYMLLQAFDFAHLFQHHNCKLQIGGSDQWGNITAGLEYIRRRQLGSACALSFPLITNSQGKKFGKSESGSIWLNGCDTSPYRFHQFWLNTDDKDVSAYLKIFTFLPLEQIKEIEKTVAEAPEKREAQKILADSVCTLVHGEQATIDAKKSAEVLFGGSIEGLDSAQLEDIFADVPSSEFDLTQLSQATALDAFADSGLVASRGEGKRLIKEGGAYLNNKRVTDPGQTLADAGALDQGVFVLRSGKKKYHLVKVRNG